MKERQKEEKRERKMERVGGLIVERVFAFLFCVVDFMHNTQKEKKTERKESFFHSFYILILLFENN